ncbi:MAG: hypothetical protein Q9M39_01695, partial [Sulfurovum sp.]|nr:hypothetical protein [Sulfurovum sp.]
MLKIHNLMIALVLMGTLVQANDKKQVIVSKFKHQAKSITPLSITKFEVIDKHGNIKIVDLKGKKFVLVSVSEPGSEG